MIPEGHLGKDQRIVFLHNPKCAGGTIHAAMNLALGCMERRDPLMAVWEEPERTQNRFAIGNPRALDVYDFFDSEEWEKAFKFTCIRNPYDRMASHYHWESSRDWRHEGWTGEEEGNLEVFLDHYEQIWTTGVGDGHIVSQLPFFRMADHSIRFENLTQEWDAMQKFAGFHPLQHHHKSPNTGGYQKMFDKHRERVECLLGDEALELGYDWNGRC